MFCQVLYINIACHESSHKGRDLMERKGEYSVPIYIDFSHRNLHCNPYNFFSFLFWRYNINIIYLTD